jgi:hypothetical protein
METGQGQFGGPIGHSEGNGEESAVAILRFLCGRPRLCRLRTDGLVLVSSIDHTDRMLVIWAQ